MSALDQMRERVQEQAAKGPKRARKAWAPPDLSRFRVGTVLTLDQTLTHTGWVILNSLGNGYFDIPVGGCIDLTTDLQGFEESYAKAAQLERHLSQLMMSAWNVDTIVHEMPATQGYRIESSLMAGREVRRAAQFYAPGVPVVAVSNQAMKALLLPPDKRYEKSHVKGAVEALIPKELRQTARWNEHVHDAVALGITHMYEKETP